MRYFFRRRIPEPTRLLLIESGSRRLLENLLPDLRKTYGEIPIDLVTCFGGLPAGLDPASTTAYNVNDYRGRAARKRLYTSLIAAHYEVIGMICSAEPILGKWKWALAAHLPAKIFVLNENGDYFWLDYSNWQTIREFVLVRAGLFDAGAVRTLARIFLFPFTFLYLLLYATTVHCKRALRSALR